MRQRPQCLWKSLLRSGGRQWNPPCRPVDFSGKQPPFPRTSVENLVHMLWISVENPEIRAGFFQPAPRFQGTSAPLFCRQQGINARPRPETPLLFSRSSGSLSTIFARASCGFQVTVLGRPAAFFFFSFLPAAKIPVLSRLFGFRLPPVGCM